MLGEQLNPILAEIENIILEHDAFNELKPNYSDDGFRAATKIFMSALIDKMFDKQTKDKKTLDECMEEVELAENKIKDLILEHTNIDAHKFYE